MKGFSLIEFTVSLFIIAVAIVLTGAMLHAGTLTRHVKDEDLAAKIASNEMENLRSLGYSGLPVSGTFSDPLMAALPQGAGTIIVSTYDTKTKKVQVVVSWTEAGAGTTYSVPLTTLVTQVGGLP
jgi:prepilin-type N-terminal cleavage/methylation domain-containing protein